MTNSVRNMVLFCIPIFLTFVISQKAIINPYNNGFTMLMMALITVTVAVILFMAEFRS